MKRFLEDDLVRWKDDPGRKPLILKGLRQCGKTYLLREFGSRHFNDTAYFNFEGNRRLAAVFEPDLDTDRIISELSAIHGRTITPDTLVIFDEVQFCYAALTSLKYFCENAPQYHIACAGSLLGLKLSRTRRGDDILSFPVGKVDFLKLRPMCFGEYVLARDGEAMFRVLADTLPYEPFPESAMMRLDTLLTEFICVGGMPEAVHAWVSTGSMEAVDRIHRNILASYENDLAKHSGESFEKISRVWASVAEQVAEDGDRFRLKEAGGNTSTLSGAISWLIDADLIRRVWEVNDDRSPPNPRGGIYYKLYFNDVGLLRSKTGMSWDAVRTNDARTSKLRGALTENFALQELDYALDRDGHELCFWKNEKGRAEVDFIADIGSSNIPIEVKSGDFGRIMGLETYCGRYSPGLAVVASRRNVRSPEGGRWMMLPLCLLWRFREYAQAHDASIREHCG